MEVKTERESETLIARAEGRIDSTNARDFEDAMTAVIDESDRAVIIDCENLAYISSAGPRSLLLIGKELWNRDAKLALCSLSASIREVFEISGFDKIIPIHGSRAEALKSLAG